MSFTREQWCRDVLSVAGNSTPDDVLIDFMVGWTVSETKTDSGARFNLLNSEHKAPGSTAFNPNGVQNYVSYAQGVQMTVSTLNDGKYTNLLNALKNNTIAAFTSLALAILADLHMWCGGCGYGANFLTLGPMHRLDAFSYGEATMTDYASALWMPNSNFFPDTGKKSFLILHGTAGGSSAQEIAQYFQGTQGSSNPVSSHYIVGQDGMVVQCVLEKDGAYAQGVVTNSNWQGNPNDYCISIEHVKSSTDNSDALTPVQQAASFALIKDICQRNGIGMHDADNTTGITGHFAIDPVNRARCPGNYPWSDLWNYLSGGQEQPMSIDLTNGAVANFFTGNATQWTCSKNGFTIHGEILAFYQTHGGDTLCGLTDLGLPQSNELPVDGKPGVVKQEFERGCVEFDPNKQDDNPPGSGRVYKVHFERDPRAVALQSQIVTLQAEVTSLKALLASSNLGQVASLGQQIADDVALIMKLVSTQ